ncbi:MAG TPA: S8 family serine peptidase [Thermoanaerobaculia bacterium]|nr:S8 family serine peptidase [Thermoanaerobaculia bacterium]
MILIDSGVNPISDFQTRIRQRVKFVTDAAGYADPSAVNDCNGYGTGVGTLAAGYRWGVAKSAQVVSVRVLNCNKDGWNGDLIAGVRAMCRCAGAGAFRVYPRQGWKYDERIWDIICCSACFGCRGYAYGALRADQ